MPNDDKNGCRYCSGERVEYQYTRHTKLFMNTLGKARTLEVECTSCPPFAVCIHRNVPTRSAFRINYCPNCGRELLRWNNHAEQ
jgi:hypothetical protein